MIVLIKLDYRSFFQNGRNFLVSFFLFDSSARCMVDRKNGPEAKTFKHFGKLKIY